MESRVQASVQSWWSLQCSNWPCNAVFRVTRLFKERKHKSAYIMRITLRRQQRTDRHGCLVVSGIFHIGVHKSQAPGSPGDKIYTVGPVYGTCLMASLLTPMILRGVMNVFFFFFFLEKCVCQP